LNFGLDPAAEACIEGFLREVRQWGARINLVGSTTPKALQTHLEDSLVAAAALPPSARVVDLGSGAGFPGIPIAIARPDLEVVLVEIRERRTHFLRHVIRRLVLDCEVWRRSVEDPGSELFDAVLVRALAPPERALPMAQRWARPEGEVWLWTRTVRLPPDFEEVGSLSLGVRGRIARVRLASVPRGTP
jgi:16S rRNA (guanine527-N7)-methyltransferase